MYVFRAVFKLILNCLLVSFRVFITNEKTRLKVLQEYVVDITCTRKIYKYIYLWIVRIQFTKFDWHICIL